MAQNDKQLICPYCRSTDVTIWGVKNIDPNGNEIKIYRCYSCGQQFEVRHIKGCGDKIFAHGDNFPLIPKEKLGVGDKVRIKIDTGIYREGIIIGKHPYNEIYKVRFKQGHKELEDNFKKEQLELIGEEKNIILDRNKIIAIGKDSEIRNIILRAKERHEKFKDMGKITRQEIDDLLIDLWEEEQK